MFGVAVLMLPYRFPVRKSGGKSNEDEYVGGGPLQRAIQQDLLGLKKVFLRKLRKRSCQSPEHDAAGCTFAVFLEVFKEKNAAMLHSKLVNAKVDPEAVSQLLYAACLNLITSSSQILTEISFGLFSLYAFYQSNPRQTQVSTTNSLDMLPLGQDLLHTGRSFKQPVRVDSYSYAALQMWRDRSIQVQDDCQALRMSKWPNVASHCCNCGVATDYLGILDKLRPHWDFCEYTGPVGIEGYAGHSDYPMAAKGCP